MTTNSENNKSFAETLHEKADSVHKAYNNSASKSIIDFIRAKAKFSSENGKFEIYIYLDEVSWSKEALAIALTYLQEVDKFQILRNSEITAWHTNTDYDSRDTLTIKW